MAADQLFALVFSQKDGFAGAAEDYEAFDATAMVSRDGMRVSGDSIMGLLMLGAHKGTTIEVETTGAQAQELCDALEALVSNRFGEDA